MPFAGIKLSSGIAVAIKGALAYIRGLVDDMYTPLIISGFCLILNTVTAGAMAVVETTI